MKKKKTGILIAAAAALLVTGAAGCGSSALTEGRDSKYEGYSGPESGYAGASGSRDGKEEEAEAAGEGETAEQEKKKPVRAEGQEIVGITSKAEEGYSSELERLFAEGVGDILSREELTWFGTHISEINYETAMASLEKNGFHIEKDNYQNFQEEEGYYYSEACYGDNGTQVSISQKADEDRVEFIDLGYDASCTGPAFVSEIRDITVGEPMEAVLEKLGFTNADEIAAYITEKQQLVYSSLEECVETAETYLTLERADGSETIVNVSVYLTAEIDGQQHRIGREGESGAIYIGHYPGRDQDCAVTMVFDTDYKLLVLRLE